MTPWSAKRQVQAETDHCRNGLRISACVSFERFAKVAETSAIFMVDMAHYATVQCCRPVLTQFHGMPTW
jgi:hypothetical protein